MARMIGYRFENFPFVDAAGHETPKSGSIIAIAPRVPEDGFRRWRAVRAVLDGPGQPPLCPACRAKVETWLHEMRKHDEAIRQGLSRAERGELH